MSALIHAATMVTAGVYLMVRISPCCDAPAPWAPTVIAIVGAVTALFAATIAVAQNDIKKVLAYSTVSQLGYMFLAVGSGAYVAAIFHMITHAFFKALLFLGSGSVIHGMHDEQDMRQMGALRKLHADHRRSRSSSAGWRSPACRRSPASGARTRSSLFACDKSPVLYVVGLVTALLTAYYMTRQVIMVFFGKARWDDARTTEHGAHGDFKPHESPRIMLLPAGRARRPVDRRRAHPAAVRSTTASTSSTWLEPVVEVGERTSPAPGADDIKYLLMAVAIVAVGRRASSLAVAGLRQAQGSRPSSRRSSPRAGTTTRPSSAFMGGPGPRGVRGRRLVRRATSSTARSTASASCVRGDGRRACARCRPATCATTPRRSASASSLLLAWFVVVPGDAADASRRRSRSSRRWSLVPAVGALVVALLSEAPPRVVKLIGAARQRRHRRR